MYDDDEFLMLSGIQHFNFCRRQWGLIHLADEWQENVLTTDGAILHERAHDDSIREHRGDIIICRGLTVHSTELGIIGQCDVVEFHKSEQGHPLIGEDGLWSEIPVEYKRGHSKDIDADRLQLAAQAMCLEEMFASSVSFGFLYYGKTKSREKVELGDDLRNAVRADFSEMHELYRKHWIPKAKPSKNCKSCSLNEICIPKTRNVSDYINRMLEGSI